MGQKLDQRISTWKKSLLDLGKRNRLINFRESKRSTVEIISPNYEDLFDKVAICEKDIVFPYAKKVHVDAEGNESYESIQSGDVETPKSIGDLQKTLKVLRYRANTAYEEQGINILFLAFGLLKWKESDNSSQTFISPLVLVPVKLTIESISAPYKLALNHEEDIVVNPTLSYKLDNDFGIKLPEFNIDSDNINDYFGKIESVVGNSGWIIEKKVNLTYLSFLKINMYKDLERNEDLMQSNDVISAIAGEQSSIGVPAEYNNYDHDNKTKPIDVFQVVDADSSQQDAILLSKAGVSFILQGPPGTGKSQTITNIISEALADGKKVLFVSEKMAALQVVYNRLKDVGLSEFCLNLHNYKANKKDIHNELYRSISMDRKKVREEALVQLDTLLRKREKLNEYQKELHTPCSSLNNTIFNINGRLAKLENVPEYIFDLKEVNNISESQLNERCEVLSELAKIIKRRSEDYSSNVWRGASVKSLSHELRHDIDYNINHILSVLPDIEKSFNSISGNLEIDIKPSFDGLGNLMDLLSVAEKSPLSLTKWVYCDNIDDVLKNLQIHKGLHESLLIQKESVLKDFDKEILELDYYPVLQRFRTKYTSVLRVLSGEYRSDIKTLKRFAHDGVRLTYGSALSLLNVLQRYHEAYESVSSQADLMSSLYERYYNGTDTDWAQISESVQFAKELKAVIGKYGNLTAFVEKICTDRSSVKYCRDGFSSLKTLYNQTDEHLRWFFSLFDNVDSFKGCSINELCERLAECRDRKYLLEEWIDYRLICEKCENIGLSSYVLCVEKERIEPDVIVGAYLKRFYRLWLDAVLEDFPEVRTFRGTNHEQTIKEFCQLDEQQLKIAQARVRERVCRNMPDFDSITSPKDEIGILKRELKKQRRLMSLRRMFMSVPNLVTILRPCFMMSPLSVSVFLEARSYAFDLVIFDEASQVHTEDAIGAIMRGKQVVIVGDTKQLPPTNFFRAGVNDDDYDIDVEREDDEAGAYDSVLDEAAAVLPERSLRWHYRSKHEHLIAFSNAKIYNSKLITFPSVIEKGEDIGVEYVYVADGIYDRGGKKNNIVEANKVADLVFEHFRKYPARSLGVVTFSESQQLTIETVIQERRRQNGAFEKFFSEGGKEPFFIKNLENVQGDERDTIIFSIGYAKDNRGIMYMNFGPLSKDEGYRRLNVAITRAKYNVKLVGSILPTDIDIDKVSYDGVKMLRSYIEFAQQGEIALQKELHYNLAPEFDSPFEEAVYDFLESKGYDVVTQVGCSGFRIDMAIKHPQLNNRFVIGIECDGATYHNSRTARERDRLRQAVLESMGWKIYRIWSTDWIKNQKFEEDRLMSAIDKALSEATDSNISENDDKNSVCASGCDEFEEIVEKPNNENAMKDYFDDYEFVDIDELDWSYDDVDAVKKVVAAEQPIHFDELCRRVAPIYDRRKSTSVVRNSVQWLIKYKLDDEVCMDEYGFVTMKGFVLAKARRSLDNVRKIEYISRQELSIALKAVAGNSCGITPENLFVVTANKLGYKRISENIISHISEVYKDMLEKNVFKEVDGKVVLLQA